MNPRGVLSALALVAVACGRPATPSPVAELPPPTTASPPAPVAVSPAEAPAAREDDAAVPITARNPTWGSRLALVTIVEFADFQCPYSSRVQPTLSALRESYGPDRLRIVWKNHPLPFHKNASGAAEAATGVLALAGRDGFWRFHDLAFQNQTLLSRDQYVSWAQQVGVTDVAGFEAGLDSHQWSFAVEDDSHQADTLGASGTPSFFINGVLVSGAQPLSKFKEVVDAELAKASAQLEAGTAPDRLYAKLAGDNRAAQATRTAPPAPDDAESARVVFKMPLGKGPVRGPATALVTIVEFADFQCPFSARVQDTLRSLVAKYGDQVRIVWRNEPLPFHIAAEPAAEAALEVRSQRGDAAFWDLHDRFFASQKDLTTDGAPNIEAIADLAAAGGASRARVKAAVVGKTHKSELAEDQAVGDDFQASGTPHFFINGRRLVGAQPQAAFEKIIDEEIAKAKGLLGQGVKAPDLYATLIKDGTGPAEPERHDLPRGASSSGLFRGNPNAKVTLHEWADFQCPFCGRVEPTLQKLSKDYGTRLKIVWHDLPLPMHPRGKPAAQAAREAFQQKGLSSFWSMHDTLFANQQHLERADLDGYAAALKLDPTRWAAALDAESHAAQVEADMNAANEGGLSGTPAFIIVTGSATRGYFISGAQDYRRFARLLDRALGEAR